MSDCVTRTGLTIETFRPYHLELIKLQGSQPSQVRTLSHVPAGCASVARLPGPALTARQGDHIVLCGGIMTVTDKMGLLWAVLSHRAGAQMLTLHRCTERFIAMHRLRRLEATVEEGFAPGCRWLALLGFQYEGKMAGYGDDGETHLRFARVTP